ncbi:enoyl-[acyl-carrier-protein] reductase FabI [Egibacter rhizosphaerae]|uniref:Enoyl-[acyl-carrier-protein] reductase [NADH] n=1 Tax=Egibacter rhizosphaerae TaxID=1670831 RepID=A0A411YKE6_9ACTN|nr:enoyl-ACP reductase FabI [Egibacter rhizosphaerae]QBI21694.1 enoyl-[acyl-carrier-protein] reductase FabI [Egibacter rhizosphaerae]
MLLNGKRILVTGVLTETSIAYSIARMAQEQGAEIVLTGHGRTLRITERIARKLPDPPDVLEMDVTQEGHIPATAARLAERWDAVDGIVHAIAFAPSEALGGNFLQAAWEDVSTALHISTYSYVAIAHALASQLRAAGGGSILGLDFDAQLAWPGYDWMGVAKAGLESANRYLARDLGPQGTRANLIAAGPVKTMAAKSVEGFELFEEWHRRAPLGWDVLDPEPVARVACALLSDWMPAVTGEVIHCDGGTHAIGGSSDG